jgi:hypothetical protein
MISVVSIPVPLQQPCCSGGSYCQSNIAAVRESGIEPNPQLGTLSLTSPLRDEFVLQYSRQAAFVQMREKPESRRGFPSACPI